MFFPRRAAEAKSPDTGRYKYLSETAGIAVGQIRAKWHPRTRGKKRQSPDARMLAQGSAANKQDQDLFDFFHSYPIPTRLDNSLSPAREGEGYPLPPFNTRGRCNTLEGVAGWGQRLFCCTIQEQDQNLHLFSHTRTATLNCIWLQTLVCSCHQQIRNVEVLSPAVAKREAT